MIENALVVGAKIRWMKPNVVNAPLDGEVVASVNPANQMTYLGSDLPKPKGGLFRKAAPRGYQMPVNTPLRHTWLDYIPGRTAYVTQGTDVLTGFMSGCLIARGTFNGNMSVFHLGTIQDPTVTRLVKTGLRTELPGNATGFYPADAFTVGERTATRKATDIIALVTGGGAFYSIMLCHGAANEYTIGGIKLVPPINRVRIMTKLM